MKKTIPLFLALLLLAGCVSACSLVTPKDEADSAACSVALVESGSTDPAALALIAAGTPACQALASDALSAVLQFVKGHNLAQHAQHASKS